MRTEQNYKNTENWNIKIIAGRHFNAIAKLEYKLNKKQSKNQNRVYRVAKQTHKSKLFEPIRNDTVSSFGCQIVCHNREKL